MRLVTAYPHEPEEVPYMVRSLNWIRRLARRLITGHG